MTGNNQLSIVEHNQLLKYEAVIKRGLNTFVEVGSALLAIRDEGLYRSKYPTFEEYCRERWGMKHNYANKLIAASKVVNNLGTIVPILPATETQARPLTSFSKSPEVQQEVWKNVVETAPNGHITAAHVQAIVDTYKEKPAQKPIVHFSSETPEWYTPGEIIERVIKVFSFIDLDPCSNQHENPNIPARIHFTKEDDGLTKQWFGRVYMNPPYGREISDWITKLCDQYERGTVIEGIALLPSRTDTEWFRRMAIYPRCFIWGRLNFSNSDNSAPFPSMVVYFGKKVEEFIKAFSDIGDIYARIQ